MGTKMSRAGSSICMEGSAALSLADWSPGVLVVCAMDVLAGVWMQGKRPGRELGGTMTLALA
jgi:hypothetical protein